MKIAKTAELSKNAKMQERYKIRFQETHMKAQCRLRQVRVLDVPATAVNTIHQPGKREKDLPVESSKLSTPSTIAQTGYLKRQPK